MANVVDYAKSSAFEFSFGVLLKYLSPDSVMLFELRNILIIGYGSVMLFGNILTIIIYANIRNHIHSDIEKIDS